MALPSVASASEMAPPTARAGSSREQPWADRAPWGLQTTEDRGRSRELRREPVRGAACQSGMHQFVWCSGTHRVAWRSTMPETVASLDLAEQASKGLGRMPFGGVRGHTARHGEGVGRITHTGSFQISLSGSPTQDSGRTKCLERTTGSRI